MEDRHPFDIFRVGMVHVLVLIVFRMIVVLLMVRFQVVGHKE